MKQIVLPVTVHLNIRCSLPSCSRNRQTRPTARSRRPMPARDAVTAAGAGSASMKKSKPEPIPVMDYRQYRRARGWYMSAATMTAATVSRWTMGRNVSASSPFPTPCCAGGSGAAVLPLDRELETALFPPPGRQAVRRLRGAVHPRLQPGQILPGMCAESPPAAKGRVRAPRRVQRGQLEGKNPL